MDQNVVVAIGKFSHHGTGDPGVGLRHQSLQFRLARGEGLSFALPLLAIVQIVFAGIGRRRMSMLYAGAAFCNSAAERNPYDFRRQTSNNQPAVPSEALKHGRSRSKFQKF